MKPNFLVIGAAKCATTTIRSLLGRHPDVFMVPTESQFFNNDSVFARGFDWYESLSAGAGSQARRGEGCNGYTMKEAFPRAFARLTSVRRRAQAAVRSPRPVRAHRVVLDGTASQHPDYVHYDFNKAVDVNRDWLTDPSNYFAQLEPYRRFYGDESIHVVFYEDLRTEPDRVLRGCFRFLGVDPDVDVGASTARLNESEGKMVASPILSQLRSISFYRRAVDRLPFAPRDRIARTLLYRRIRQRPDWHPETRAWVADLLRDDLRRFLVQYGKKADFWNFDGVLDAVGDAVVEEA